MRKNMDKQLQDKLNLVHKVDQGLSKVRDFAKLMSELSLGLQKSLLDKASIDVLTVSMARTIWEDTFGVPVVLVVEGEEEAWEEDDDV